MATTDISAMNDQGDDARRMGTGAALYMLWWGLMGAGIYAMSTAYQVFLDAPVDETEGWLWLSAGMMCGVAAAFLSSRIE